MSVRSGFLSGPYGIAEANGYRDNRGDGEREQVTQIDVGPAPINSEKRPTHNRGTQEKPGIGVKPGINPGSGCE